MIFFSCFVFNRISSFKPSVEIISVNILNNIGLANVMPLRSHLSLAGDEYIQQAAVPLGSETHSIEDVAIFAKGPMSHLFHSVQEQSYIAHVMAYAACLPPYENCILTLSHAGSVYPSLLLLLIGLLPLSLSTL